MNEALRQKFQARFFAVAAARYGKARAALASGDLETVRAETHALAGEAFMLGETAIGDLASAAERASMSGDKSTEPLAALGALLDRSLARD